MFGIIGYLQIDGITLCLYGHKKTWPLEKDGTNYKEGRHSLTYNRQLCELEFHPKPSFDVKID